MARRPRSPTGRGLAAVGVLVLVAWIAFITIEIATEPEAGAASVDALTARAASALGQRDADALQELMVDDAPADYADQLLDGFPATDGALDGEVERSDRGDAIMIADPAGQGTCLTWQVVPEDGRYLLDVVPPLTGCR
ncbi:hypothetical protein [uncultured Modestobacter sp.]|uniref:hypothetical protein n=1 Tax=uncultured Modestobacter sp. TaxID=380048 RepID=UPI00261258A7|nr:hypothetical protein [uncultured Modestobacter sp.]